MSGTTYIVEIDLRTKGSVTPDKIAPGLKGASDIVSKLGKGLSDLSAPVSKLFGLFDGVVQKVAEVGIGIAKIGAVAATGAITYGVVKLNQELENTKIGLGAIFAANGAAADLPEGMRLASTMISKMKKDAAALPGEFEDLVGIYQNVAIPGLRAGMDPKALEEFSAKTMAAGAVAQLPMDQVAREASQLLMGRAGSHNVLGMKLMGLGGDDAKAFNQLSPEKRLAKLNAELDKYKSSIDEFGKSFSGVSSSLVDNGKQFLTIATSGLFEKLKDTFSKVNDWFTENKALVASWAASIAERLGGAFDVAVSKVEQWWPAIETFASNAYNKLVSIWETIQPYVEKFGDSLQSALKDPGTIDKLTHIAELWAAGKTVGAGVGALGSLGQAANGAMTIGKILGFGGAAAAGGAAATGGAVAMGAGGLTGGTMMGAAAMTLVGPVLGAIVTTGLALWQAFKLGGDVVKLATENEDAKIEAASRWLSASDAYVATTDMARESMDALSGSAIALGGAFDAAVQRYDLARKRQEQDTAAFTADYLANLGALLDPSNTNGAGSSKSPKHPGGGGGTHIDKVEITVAGNQEPNRVAALVVDVLNRQKRHRRTSPDVRSFSSGT